MPRPKGSRKRRREEAVSVTVTVHEQELGPGPNPDGTMEDLWKEAFPVGTEWDQYERVYEIDWEFTNLEEAFEEGGVLHGKRVYLFGCTEPQLVQFKDTSKVIHIPAVVAVTSPFPPSDKIGIKSVQMEGEMIVPMREMKFDWVPFIPEESHTSLERYKAQIFTLKCSQRRAALRQLKQERIKKFEYCLPYLYQPLKEEELQQDTIVSIMYPFDDDRPPIVTEFDWEFDELEEFVQGLVQEEVLPKEESKDFQEFVKEKVKEEKKKQKEAREARRRAIDSMSEETKNALENMKFFKFYPVSSPDVPDISECKSPFINRYYGKATQVL